METNDICCCEQCGKSAPKTQDGETGWNGNKIRMIAGSVLFVLSLGIAFELVRLPALSSIKSIPFIELSLFLAAFLLIGADVLLRSIKNIAHGKIFDENFLMSVSSIGAFCIGEYPEAVAVMLFYKIGEAFEDSAVGKSRSSISRLMDIKPEYANIKHDDRIERAPPSEVRVGDIIVVKVGERVPLDGIVIDGLSSLDVSALTGESAPRDVGVGSGILSGSINKTGVLSVQVTKTERESTVSKILELVEHNSEKKSRIENFITRFARYYTPFVCISALLLALLPPLCLGASSLADFSPWVYRALVFLVVSCPCALVISVPLSFFGGIGAASKNGILIKGSNYLEALYKAKTIIFDKTGTLTKGIFRVSDIVPSGSFSKEEVLFYAAHAESISNHPIALSICSAYQHDIDSARITGAQEIAGNGIKVVINGKQVIAGNAKFFESEAIAHDTYNGTGTLVYIAVENLCAGFIIINDEIKEDAAQAVKELKQLGMQSIVMLTGDTKLSAETVAREIGIDSVSSGLLPHEKCERLEAIKNAPQSSGAVLFVGDGINDAPCLALSDAGIAMGGIGSDAAIEAADIVLMNDELRKIPLAIRISQRTHRIALQNIVFALGIKGIILLAGALGSASIWVAVFGDVGVALLAILNSMRALKMNG
ncbi:MAG: cadmium-translocating P-type ATPase [Spirochaetaceae bacterium]|jgi:Cd2+/Zn2+-exporting ATPase|nr:cadmium-translocating P-type ATPase [Spirochaetaceae bacterium]